MSQALKRARSSGIITSTPVSPQSPSKKIKLLNSYTSTSPFPSWSRPSAAEALQIHELLTRQHRTHAPRQRTTANNSAATCGHVPNVIDSLIGTILSQNTSSRNSSEAKSNLDRTFGRYNFGAIAVAPRAQLVEVLRRGGLANKKAATIQAMLASIKDKHGSYSLQHLTSDKMSDSEVMAELMSYDGVGPKTAACVMLFCLGRQLFAVDTHVFRLSKLLGWVPSSADRVKAQSHLDLLIPGELKYDLHVLMVQHGRECKGCKKRGRGQCILKDWLKTRKELVSAVDGLEQ